jgi:hypothetical protein
MVMVLSRCIRKIKGLAVRRQNLVKSYVIVNIGDNPFAVRWRRKTRGGNMKDSLAMLLKTNGGKMPDLASLAMLMKIHGLFLVSRDVDEKKDC